MAIKLKEIVEFKGTLKVGGSGLRIGAEKENVGIGENENPIIRHPITRIPYVPGSSIKGKIRSLLESMNCQHTQQTGEPCSCGICLVCQLFGCGSARTPTRLVFRDCQPTVATKEIWSVSGVDSEIKMEVKINRTTGTTDNRSTPRPMERIPAGSDFDFAFSLRIFEGDDTSKYYTLLAEGFDLLEKHYLGGSGSRGYGEVAVVVNDGAPMAAHLLKKAKGA